MTLFRGLLAFLVFLIAACFCLNFAERSELDLAGTADRPVVAGIEHAGDHEYIIYVLGAAHHLDVAGGLGSTARTVSEAIDTLCREAATRLRRLLAIHESRKG